MLLGGIYAQSQDKITLSVFQDAKLLVSGDNHGNSAGTKDLIFNMDWEGYQFEYYFFTVRTQFETANLSSASFSRYSVHVGWTFNKLIIPKLEAGIFAGVGIIHRGEPLKVDGAGTYSLTGELSYPISNFISVSAKYEIVRRSDLVWLYNTDQPFKPNFSIGVKFNVSSLFK